MLFYVYTLTNTINGKSYVGVTNDPFRRFEEHLSRASRFSKERCLKLSNALNKHGVESFKLYIVHTGSKEFCYLLETHLIKKLNSFKEGYNASLGGEGSGRYQPWNKGTKGKCRSNKTTIKPGWFGELALRSKLSDAERFTLEFF